MGKLFKFLRPYGGAVLAILCVLVVQAYCDLSLPTYTSDIVNVGLQQKGIEEKVPEVIGEEDLNQLLLFVPSEKQETVKEAYETGPAPSEAYEGNVLEISGEVKEDEGRMEELSEILGKPMLLCSGFASGSEFSPEMGMQMEASQREAIVKEIEEQLSAMPETMVEQSAAVYIGNVYEKLGIDLDRRETEYILSTGAKMLALALLGMLASILVGLIASRVGARMGQSLRKDVFRKVVSFSNGEFDKFSTASLITRSTNDIQQIQLLTVMILRMVLYAPIMAAGGIFKVFRTNVDMSWIIALAVALIVSVVAVLFVVVMPKFKVVQNMVDRLNLVSREILTGLQVIRAFSTEQYEEKRFDSANRDLTKTNLFVNRAMTFMMPLMMLIMNGIAVLIVWVGGHSINDGSMQVGDMMAFIQYTMQIIMSFLMICMISVMLPRAAVSADRVDEILTSGTLIHDPESPKDFAENAAGEVVFDHVSFRYPGAEEDVLHDISFTAKPGETTAFIGSTGSGKSTLVNLIPRFYDVTEGRILIDGVDLREVSQHDLRDRLGYVPQKGVLFSGDIASNILYGNPGGGKEEMTEAAAIAQAEEFIGQKQKGYQSPIAQGGSNVSGGQKQRLSIARAIAKHPDIYIFDDSFSALDYKTDVKLRNALKDKTKDSTVMIVAQRISTILHAEQIIVLDDGKVAGKGTHRELLKNCEEYYQIASSQLSEKELENDMKEAG
ncbi:MAG: ABC transporter ATP-binding protein [Dorea sp.]|jgi:ATP-binding cassette subfamily B multidrug efflux pump|nr:ABC transporter ATP-binding protein [Dorea sp.]